MATNTDGREEIKPVAPTEQTKWRDPSLVGKYMVDPKTGLAGLFRSPDNGETWVLTDTVYGHVYNQDEVDNIWDNGAGHKVADEVKSATADLPNVRKQADEAVKFAESAVAASKVNSDAIVAQSEAISEAKSAMDSATAEIQQTAANAASDAAKIRADVARVQNEVDTAKSANSASVDKLKSDIGLAQKDLDNVRDSLTKAQSAVEQNQKLINDSVAKITSDVSATKQDLAEVHDSLTKAQAAAEQNQKAINDNVAQINSNIEQDRKDIASAQQANADTAKQLDAYSKQATEQGKTIKSIQDKQDGFTATIADVQGNVTQVSDKVSGLSASLKDAQDNVASVKAQADQLSATLTNHAKSIATLTASANELSSTLEDADGRLSKVEQTAQTNSSTLSDVQGDLSQVKQDATTLTTTLKDAQGNISTLQQKADSVSAQLASAQGDITSLQTDVTGIKATLVSHEGDIHTLQADNKSLKDSMADAQGDISTLSKTATDVTSELEDHTGRLSKVEQTASKQATTLSDLQGNLSQVEQKADSNTATISSINKNAMQDRGVITDTKTSFDSLTQLGTYSIKASGLSMMPEQHYGTLVVSGSAGSGWLSQQFVADTTGNVYTRVFSNNAWSAWKQGGSQDAINQVKQTADSNSATIRNVQGDVNTLKQTATGVEVALADHEGDIHTLQADSKTLKDDMADAKGNISSLQKTSTSLVSEFRDHDGRLSKVEQTATEHTSELADTKGNIDSLKQRADSLQVLLGTAQQDINNIKINASGLDAKLTTQGNDINQIKANAAGMSTRLSGVETAGNQLRDQLNRLKIGTSNLLHHSDTFDGWIKGYSVTVTADKYLDGRIAILGGAGVHGGQLTTYLDGPYNDDLVTWTVYAKADNVGDKFHTELWGGGGITDQALTTEWQSYKFTGQRDARNHAFFLWGCQGNKGNVYVALPFAVIGNTIGSWSPNNTDVADKITTNTVEINATKKMVEVKADKSEVDNVKGTVNQVSAEQKTMADQISQKVSSAEYQILKDKVNGMKIGTRNLLHHSDTFEGWHRGSTVSIAGSKYLNGTVAILAPGGSGGNALNADLDGPYDNQPISWTVYAKADNTGDKLHTELWGGGGLTEQPLTTEWQVYKFTGQRDARKHSFLLWGCVGNKGNIYVALPFAVVGNYIGTWLANPTDTITSINKNSTAIDENSKLISLKANQTDVDNIKGTAQQLSARLDVMAGEVKSKVDETRINNIVDGKGYATTSTVQSLVDQKAGTLSDTITELDRKIGDNHSDSIKRIQSLAASIDGLQSRVTNYQNDTSSKYTQLSSLMQSKVNQGDLSSVRTQLANAINDRVGKGELMSQINLQAGNTLIQSNKLYLDASSVVITGTAFIPSAAIASLNADKVNAGWLNTNNVNLGDGRTRIIADHDYMYIQPTGSAASNTGIRMGYSGLDFLTNVIPNGYNSSVPYYSIGYDGASNGYLRISAFDHINPGGTTATQNWYTMVDAISLTNSEINFGAHGNMHMQVVDGGVNIKPTLFFQNNTNNGTWAGFTRADNSNIVEFSSGDNNGENFRIDCGARFMQYVYINGNARAQQWLTNSALSKKMNIRKLDLQTALDKIRQDDQYLYEYKRNVAQGIHDPQASFIIDDVHDVAHYSVPREFIDNTGKYREPSVELAYLIAAFQAIDKQVQKQKEEIKELKEKLQHE